MIFCIAFIVGYSDIMVILNISMFRRESLLGPFFQSEDESRPFHLPGEEDSFSFPLSGFLSIERERQAGRESSNEYLAQDTQAFQVFIETDCVQSRQADVGSQDALRQELSYRMDSSKAKSSLHLLKKNGEKQKNPSPSKNFLLYAWKKLLKCLKLSKNPKLQECWNKMKKQKGSLESFDKLFRSLKCEEDLSAIFESKILLQWLMLSPMDNFLKKAYLPYFRRLEHAYKKGYIHHLK